MAAPILWAPGIFWFFLLENPHAHNIPPLGGVLGFLRGGVEVPILFYGRGDFSEIPIFRNDLPCFKNQLTCNPDLVPVWGCLVPVCRLSTFFIFKVPALHLLSAGFALLGAGFALLSAGCAFLGEKEKD